MSQSEDIDRAKKALNRRLSEWGRLYARVMELNESRGKSAVVSYIASEFNAEPIACENTVAIGKYLVVFDINGKLKGISSRNRAPAIVARSDSNRLGDAGDT